MATKKAPPKPVAKVAKKRSSLPLDPNSKTSQRLSRMVEGNLSDKQKDRAERFILQYMRDFNATQAFVRTRHEEDPYNEVDLNYASNVGYQMMRWPYVAQRVHEMMEEAEEAKIVSRNEVLWGLKREANYRGVDAKHSARISGWSALAKILGMETKKIEANFALRGGVMIVPETQDLKTWEQRAKAAQAALKEEVRK